ncbi:hypothetical protein P5673_020052 [Acropora cervicornis]|uniref:Uncharacterized protein n=1 Tax=Acropora cervicornis TaxID=6130 RepID=A0AAD9V1W4_ACRCE|nr:hypothetical protein P5673_020052 [Acropora cervicornis]
MNTEFVTFLLLASLVSTVSGFPFRSEELIKELKTKEFQVVEPQKKRAFQCSDEKDEYYCLYEAFYESSCSYYEDYMRAIKRKMVRSFNEFVVVLMVLSLVSQSGLTMSIAAGTIPKEVAAARFFRSLQRHVESSQRALPVCQDKADLYACFWNILDRGCDAVGDSCMWSCGLC